MQGCSLSSHKHHKVYLKFLLGFDTFWQDKKKLLIVHKKLKSGKPWKIDFFMIEVQYLKTVISNMSLKILGHLTYF